MEFIHVLCVTTFDFHTKANNKIYLKAHQAHIISICCTFDVFLNSYPLFFDKVLARFSNEWFLSLVIITSYF